MEYTLEPLAEEHRQPVMEIFNYFIENSFAAYPERRLPDEFFERFLGMAKGMPSAVLKSPQGQVVGFGLLHPYSPVSSFRRSLELSYFILPEHTQRGLGGRLLQDFVEKARQMGVDQLLASICSRNEQSLAFHRKHGFVECGRFQNVGRKFGQDFDVIWMQKFIGQEAPAG